MNANFSHRMLSIGLLVACLVLPFSGRALTPVNAAGIAAQTPAVIPGTWTDPLGDIADPGVDLISGSANVTRDGYLELRAQFAGTPFSADAAQTIVWCFDTDQNPNTGTACASMGLAGADQAVILEGGPDALTTGDLHLSGALLGEDACQIMAYDESIQTLRLLLPRVYVDEDGTFNTLVISHTTGSEMTGDFVPDSPDFAIPDHSFTVLLGDLLVGMGDLPFSGVRICNYLWTDPGRLDFVAYEGAGDPPKQGLDIFDEDGAGIQWSADEDIPWLTLSHPSGITPAHIQVEVTSTGMPAGIHTGRINLTRPGRQWNGSNWLEVTLDIRQASSFDITPNEINFEAWEGQPVTPVILMNIGKIGVYDLEWRLYENIPWLHVNAASGPLQSDGEYVWDPRGEAPSQLLVWASTGLLAPGKYTGEITIASDNAQNSPQIIPVTLNVKQATNQEYTILLTASTNQYEGIDLNWTPVNHPQLAEYRIYRGRQDTADFWYVKSTQTPSYKERSFALRPNTYYCYYIAAVNSNGSIIAYSNTACAMNPRRIPPTVELTQ